MLHALRGLCPQYHSTLHGSPHWGCDRQTLKILSGSRKKSSENIFKMTFLGFLRVGQLKGLMMSSLKQRSMQLPLPYRFLNPSPGSASRNELRIVKREFAWTIPGLQGLVSTTAMPLRCFSQSLKRHRGLIGFRCCLWLIG